MVLDEVLESCWLDRLASITHKMGLDMHNNDTIYSNPPLRRTVVKLLTAASKGDGLSLSPRTGNRPYRGYMVGGAAPAKSFKRIDLRLEYGRMVEEVYQHIARVMKDAIWDTDVYLGVWVDGEGYDATVYVDASNHVFDKETAIELGRERGEIAIWDVASKEEVYVSAYLEACDEVCEGDD